MGRELARCLLFISLACAVVFILGCGTKIDTAEKLAVALKRQGVNYQTIEQVDAKHPKVDEAIAIKGANLWVEILRIEDEKTYKLFMGMGLFLFAVEKKVEKDLPDMPVNMLSKKPFVIVIRQEPEEGAIKEALNRIFPQKDD